MIEKCENGYALNCDYCSNCEDNFDDFQEAVDYKKANGWKSKKTENGEWVDMCPVCQKKLEVE